MNRLYEPCHYCKDRSVTCHGDCKKYDLAKKLKSKEKAAEKNVEIERLSANENWCYDARGVKK